ILFILSYHLSELGLFAMHYTILNGKGRGFVTI
ncbi:unnamed protein product, partial [marine sediment metagenome]